MNFRVSRKVTTKLKVTEGDLCEVASADSITEWYCNLNNVHRRQLFLFTQATTLFSFWMPAAGIKRETFGTDFRREAKDVMTSYGFPASKVADVLDEEPDTFSKCIDRGVIGSMVDFSKMLGYMAENEPRFRAMTTRDLNDIANRCPMSRLGMDCPIDRFTALLSAVGAA